jgi:Ala-tRNA(Pro) deacylase
MIPERIESYLKARHLGYEVRSHRRTVPAQMLAAAEHVSGARVAKTVVVSLDGSLAIAVVPATERVDLEALARASGSASVQIVPEAGFSERFWPCEPGAEPPLGLFGMPIYVEEGLAGEPFLVMRGGTHEDAISVVTRDWMSSEHVQPVKGLGIVTQ